MDKVRANLNSKVSKEWKPVAALQERKPGMAWSDRIWHWLVMLGGIGLAIVGILIVAYSPIGKKWGFILIALGFCTFVLGSPNMAQRNGYRD